jgi:hypothetical protein
VSWLTLLDYSFALTAQLVILRFGSYTIVSYSKLKNYSMDSQREIKSFDNAQDTSLRPVHIYVIYAFPSLPNSPPKIIDSFHFSSRIPPNMFRDKASILMEARAKRKPILATKVVGFGHVTVQPKAMKRMLGIRA